MNAVAKSGESGLWSVIVEGSLVVECELTAPPSMKGRTVHVWFKPEQIPDLLSDARAAGIVARQITEVGRVDGR